MNCIYESIISKTPIHKGWSADRKYCITTADGGRYLLRVAPLNRLQRKEMEHQIMYRCAALQIPMSRPVEFGTCEDGAYSIQSWIGGCDAEEAIMAMDEPRQYRYGVDAGRILAKIHTLPAPEDAQAWEARFNAKIDRKLAMYDACPLKYDGGEAFLRYIGENRHLLKDRPQTVQHGDYHIGNMMIDDAGVLTVIDFEKHDHGDPWEEFNRIVWCAQAAPAFASGMLVGYFDGDVPMEFWRLLALYICSNTLGSLPWALDYGGDEVQVMRTQAVDVLRWYDNMRRVIPSWYHKR